MKNPLASLRSKLPISLAAFIVNTGSDASRLLPGGLCCLRVNLDRLFGPVSRSLSISR